ncbi:MAG TPA: ComEC/Rec2 family competence protein, partial [Pirellulales bacterium]|nr:ComEC/Rec2 family competence protein [Pirellulales bacterium]
MYEATQFGGGRAGSPPRRHHQPLVIAAVAFAAGILADRLAAISLWGTPAAVLGALAIWCLAHARQRPRSAAVALIGALLALGAAWHHLYWRCYDALEIGQFATEAEQPAALEGIVTAAPRRAPKPAYDPMRQIPSGDHTRLQIRVTAIRDGRDWRAVSGNVQVGVDGHLLGVLVGDRIRVFGRASRPRAAENPGETDRAAQLRDQRILVMLHVVSPDCVTVIAPGSDWLLTRRLEQLRAYGMQQLLRYIEPNEVGLAAAVLLGEREQLDEQRSTAFMMTGTIHFITIAGLHVGILAWLLFQTLRWCQISARATALLVLAAISAYAWLTGGEPSVMRAAIMVAIVCVSIWCGQTSLRFNSLAAAALALLAYNPTDLFRPGAQLSFIAVIAISWLSARRQRTEQFDALDRLIWNTRSWPERAGRWLGRWSIQIMVTSAVVCALTAPLVMARFHTFAPIAIVLNLLFEIPITLAMVAGFGVLLLGALLPGVAAVCGVVCAAALNVLDTGVVAAGKLPGGHAWFPGPNLWWLVGFYGGLGLLLLLPRWRPRPRWLLTAILAWCAAGEGIAW